ncbi:MAG: YbhB/YbcL family Raf kinase inhibitor-like protein [Microgenomates group bacterium]
MNVTSQSFAHQGFLRERYTCRGENRNPAFEISNIPSDAQSLALIMVDLDSPYQPAHWLVWNMDIATPKIYENDIPSEATEGTNDFGEVGYKGPCPKDTVIHRYEFRFYALKDELNLDESYLKHQLESEIKNLQIDMATMIAKYDGG